MLIGGLAKATNTKVNTIRFYEDIGLMPVAARTPSGQRSYTDDDVRRLSFIRHARALGFSTDEVRSLIELKDTPDEDCEIAAQIAASHLTSVEQRLAQLKRLRDELANVVSSCSGGKVINCRIIESIAEG